MKSCFSNALLLGFCLALSSSGYAAPPVTMTSREFPPILKTLKPTRPRIIASATTWETIQARRREDATLDAFLKRGELEARAILEAPLPIYKKDESGKRLLHVSRTVLRRVLLLSQQFHLTGDMALAKRAQDEMLVAAAFKDWNPSHFLDVGEMTMALAFGHDWLYDQLDESVRQTIETAIIEKGLKAGLQHSGWMYSTNNWNQVCFAGMTLGALTVAEREPILAAQMLEKAQENNHRGLKPYAPAGVYPEGAMYWGYGTSFQVVMLSALESALGTDWGLSQSPGFMQTADAVLQTMGPTGTFFNFFDGIERVSLEGANYWFAHQLKRPELVSFEKGRLQHYSDLSRPAAPNSEGNRLMPLIAIWWPETKTQINFSAPLYWYGPGPNPLATFRSAWNEPNAMFLAIKGGKAALSHGHMDAGSFVFEADGVRWACDLGMQSYAPLEAKNVGLWDGKQEGGRWKVFRLNNFSHNTLTINNQLHRIEGHAAITHFSDKADLAGAIVDMSPVFAGQASRITRGFAFRSGNHALIRDEVEGLKEGDTVRFAMLTKAQVSIAKNGREAILTQQGKKLTTRLLGPEGARFEVISGEPPQNDYDEANPGSRFLIANFSATASGKLSWSVTLQPEKAGNKAVEDSLAITELKSWPLAVTK